MLAAQVELQVAFPLYASAAVYATHQSVQPGVETKSLKQRAYHLHAGLS
jgi:hypothetical protein